MSVPAPFVSSEEFLAYYRAVNNWSTSLVADILDTDTIIPVAAMPADVPDKGIITIGTEHIGYNAVDRNTKKFGTVQSPCVRGVDSSTAASHANGSIVQQRFNAGILNALVEAVRRRKEKAFALTGVAAFSVSDQNITGFGSIANITDLRIMATGGSSSFYIELYSKDSFRGEDLLFRSPTMSSVSALLSGATSANIVPVVSTSGFVVGELVAVGDIVSSGEFGRLESIVPDTQLNLTDNLASSFLVSDTAALAYQILTHIKYVDKDWTSELHVRVVNEDPVNSANIKLWIDAEISDEQ